MRNVDGRVVLVLGTHRSGTTMTAQVLELMGLELGRDLRPSRSHRRVLEVHDRLLGELGSSWRDLRRLPDGWREGRTAERARGELREVLEEELGQHRLWGVKDARLCRLLPLWRDLLDEAGIVPRVAITTRSPSEVACALVERDGLTESTAVALYLDHTLEALTHSEGISRVFISREHLLDNWQQVLHRAENELGLKWPNRAVPPEAEIVRSIQAGSQLSPGAAENGAGSGSLFAWATELHGAVMEASEGGSNGLTEATASVRRNWTTAISLYLPELARLSNESRVDRDGRRTAERRLEASERTRRELERALDRASNGAGFDDSLASFRDRATELEDQVIDQQAREAELTRRLEESDIQRLRIEQRAIRARQEMEKVQRHLTKILSGRLFRYTRGLRRVWYRLKRHD